MALALHRNAIHNDLCAHTLACGPFWLLKIVNKDSFKSSEAARSLFAGKGLYTAVHNANKAGTCCLDQQRGMYAVATAVCRFDQA